MPLYKEHCALHLHGKGGIVVEEVPSLYIPSLCRPPNNHSGLTVSLAEYKLIIYLGSHSPQQHQQLPPQELEFERLHQLILSPVTPALRMVS